jgi:EAL domain-containing protein (putative c-di-GMP-specific phosphodiesterase class I)
MAQMLKVHGETAAGCAACRSGNGLGFELTMAFQPIVDVETQTVYAYEALVRGEGGLSAPQVLALVNDENRYAFDQTCRVKAIELAAKLGIAEQGARLSVNFMPGAVYSPSACIRRTLQAANFHQFPLESIIFEIMEGERIVDPAHMRRIAAEYQRHGFTLALDDFGAGYSGLNLLSDLEGIRLVKLDGALIRSIDTNERARRIVESMVALCGSLGVEVLAECVETVEEYAVLRDSGIRLMQGYLFARPGYESLPEVFWPEVRTDRKAHGPVQISSLETEPAAA